jgi:hypothetical protein
MVFSMSNQKRGSLPTTTPATNTTRTTNNNSQENVAKRHQVAINYQNPIVNSTTHQHSRNSAEKPSLALSIVSTESSSTTVVRQRPPFQQPFQHHQQTMSPPEQTVPAKLTPPTPPTTLPVTLLLVNKTNEPSPKANADPSDQTNKSAADSKNQSIKPSLKLACLVNGYDSFKCNGGLKSANGAAEEVAAAFTQPQPLSTPKQIALNPTHTQPEQCNNKSNSTQTNVEQQQQPEQQTSQSVSNNVMMR